MTEVVLRAGPSLHPVEAAIVRLALHLPADPRDHARDLWDHDHQLPEDVVCLRHGDHPADAHCVTRLAGDALARLVRVAAQPAVRSGAVAAAATPPRRHPIRLPRVRLLVSTLFGVCWPAHGPRDAVSEVYRLAWLADADQWVVAAARSHAVAGVDSDRLLAAFGHRADIVTAAGEAIRAHWASLQREQGVQGRCTIVSGGRIGPDDAQALVDRVWTAPPAARAYQQSPAPSSQPRPQWALA